MNDYSNNNSQNLSDSDMKKILAFFRQLIEAPNRIRVLEMRVNELEAENENLKIKLRNYDKVTALAMGSANKEKRREEGTSLNEKGHPDIKSEYSKFLGKSSSLAESICTEEDSTTISEKVKSLINSILYTNLSPDKIRKKIEEVSGNVLSDKMQERLNRIYNLSNKLKEDARSIKPAGRFEAVNENTLYEKTNFSQERKMKLSSEKCSDNSNVSFTVVPAYYVEGNEFPEIIAKVFTKIEKE